MRRPLFLVLGAVVGVLLTAYLLTGVVQVQRGERLVIRRFGRVLEDKPGPGLHVGLPWGMDRVDRVPVELVRQVAVGYQPGAESGPTTPAGQYLTGDRNLVNIQVIIHYAVDGDDLENYAEQASRVDALVELAAESVLAEWVAGRQVDDVLLRAKTALRPRLVHGTQERIKRYRLGVLIQDASIAHLSPPEQVKEAFDDVTRAQTEKRTRENEARQAAYRALQEARAEADHLEELARTFARDQARQAQTDADSFNGHLALMRRLEVGKDEYVRLLWWQTMGRRLVELATKRRVDEISKFLSKDGLEIIVPVQMAPGQK